MLIYFWVKVLVKTSEDDLFMSHYSNKKYAGNVLGKDESLLAK